MTDCCDIFTLERVAELEALSFSGPAENGGRIVPGIYLSWDGDCPKVELALDSKPGTLLEFDATIEGFPRWFSLNLELGAGLFAVGDILGLVVEGSAQRGAALPVFLRSVIDGDLVDTDCPQPLDLPAQTGIASMFHTFSAHDAISGRSAFHTLVLGLPKVGGQFALRSLRVFRVAADRGLRSTPEPLSAFAV
jgi:hypothetical protein